MLSPMLQRWTDEHPMLPLVGRYEAHLTTNLSRPEDLLAFRLACGVGNLGCLVIELPQGEVPNQPMATCRFEGTLLGAVEAVDAAIHLLTDSGFAVTRTKIETSLENDFPAICYHEFHVELSLPEVPEADDLERLERVLARHQARLSRNALGQPVPVDPPRMRRFATLRVYNQSNALANQSCEAMVRDLTALAQSQDVRVQKVQREQVLFDSAEELDRGWI